MRARDVLRLPLVWERLTKGAPEKPVRLKPKAVEHLLRRQRWMDLIVAFQATDAAASMLHPRREDARDRENAVRVPSLRDGNP